MDDVEPAIEVKNITKSFSIPLDKGRNLKQRILGRATKGYRTFTPLNDISFTINKGDFFGIVGRNGSGKSTLLKTIAGIYVPQSGKVKVNGILVPFIELGVGFNPELSGRENVYLNAALLGFSRKEIDGMYDDIVDFAELHDFMEERLQNYSSGMQVRLAFSISIRARGDILLLDEVLAVGDSAFQQKCYDYFEQLKKDKKTVILVTHSMANVEKFCTRALLLEEGRIAYIGSSEEVASRYRELFSNRRQPLSTATVDTTKSRDVEIVSVETYQHDKRTSNIRAFEKFIVKVSLKGKRDILNPNIVINIRDKKDNVVAAAGTTPAIKGGVQLLKDEVTSVSYEIENTYTNGEYQIDAVIMAGADDKRKRIIDEQNVQAFSISGVKQHIHSIVHPDIKITIKS